jgi:nucleotide-binding universal stress UspA family protein
MSTTVNRPAPAPAGSDAPHANPAVRGPILLATDGNDQSASPATFARLLALKLGVLLEVVTVIEPIVAYSTALGGIPVYLPEAEEAIREARLAKVYDYLARQSIGVSAPSLHLRFGATAYEIARTAAQRAASFVVVGSAPRRRLNHIVSGKCAVRVLRASAVPVISVPPGMNALPKSIVVAVDFSPASVIAATAALLLVADGGTVTLMHILPPLLADAPIRDIAGRDPSDSVQTLFGRLRDELRPFVPENVTIETMIRTDFEVEGILGSALNLNADAVAVGTHGPRLLERLFVGSVAASVLRNASQMVLAAPPPPAAEGLDLWLRLTGNARTSHAGEWTTTLDHFTRRNKGRRVTLEVDDPEIGAQLLGHGILVGVTYDAHDKRVEIMLGDAQSERRPMMHSIPSVDSIALTSDEGGGREALALRHGRGQTLVSVG